MVTQRLVIYGRVQGVGYRQTMVSEAKRRGITGWVRNRHNGTVEACIQGMPQAIEHITKWARQGSTIAAVTHIDVFDEASMPLFSSFDQLPTL